MGIIGPPGGGGGLTPESVIAEFIAKEAVITEKIKLLAITTALLAEKAVTTAKIELENITTALLALGSVTEAKLSAGVIAQLFNAQKTKIVPRAKITAATEWEPSATKWTYLQIFAVFKGTGPGEVVVQLALGEELKKTIAQVKIKIVSPERWLVCAWLIPPKGKVNVLFSETQYELEVIEMTD